MDAEQEVLFSISWSGKVLLGFYMRNFSLAAMETRVVPDLGSAPFTSD